MEMSLELVRELRKISLNKGWLLSRLTAGISITLVTEDNPFFVRPYSNRAYVIICPSDEWLSLVNTLYTGLIFPEGVLNGLLLSPDKILVFFNHIARLDEERSFDLLKKNHQPVQSVEFSNIETERLVHRLARVGQFKLRKDVLSQWKGKCAVTGVNIPELLMTSHIKPWSHPECTAQERLDPDNALPLIATLDALFDKGFVSFSDDGIMILSPILAYSTISILNLSGLRLTRTPSIRQQAYLAWHRKNVLI